MLSSEIHQRLNDLFSWNPPQLSPRPRPGNKNTNSTRQPAYFDKRSCSFRVKHLPTLVRDIAAVVDKIITKGVKLHPSHQLFSADIIKSLVSGIEAEAVDEKEVASYYERTTATFCIKAASLLALSAPNLLRWSQSGNGSGSAIADGFLYFANPKNSPDAYRQLEMEMGEETVERIRALAEARSSLSTEQFKNLAAGGSEVMHAIPMLSNMPKFKWTVCTAPDCATSKREHEKRDDDGDNQNRPNPSRRPEPSYTPDKLPVPTPKGRSLLVKQKSVLTNVTQPMPPPPPAPGVQVEACLPGEPGGVKGKRKVVAKGRTTVQGSDDDDGGDFKADPSYKDAQDLSAQYIVQQAWAQATRADCSILLIQAGNYEIIGIRHRLSQTLYISDLIEPHACREPSYGKLHTGIYVAAVNDAIDRAEQRSTGNGDGSNGSGPSGGSSGSRSDHKDDESDVMAHEVATQRTLDLASRRDVVLLYLQYGVYDSPAPSTFVRSGPNRQALVALPSQETVKNYQLENCLSIVLKSEIGHGATGTVLRGTLDVGLSAGVLLDVVVKLALGSERGDTLRNEYKIYNLLRKFGFTAGITIPLGLFDDVEGGACALLMPYRGTPLAARPEFRLTPSYHEAILATLKNIHAAGILHGDLRLENILVADSGHTIIDFGRSRVCYDEEAKKHEYSQLQSLLTQCGKQKVGTNYRDNCNRFEP